MFHINLADLCKFTQLLQGKEIKNSTDYHFYKTVANLSECRFIWHILFNFGGVF